MTRPERNWPGKQSRFELSNRIRNLVSRRSWNAMAGLFMSPLCCVVGARHCTGGCCCVQCVQSLLLQRHETSDKKVGQGNALPNFHPVFLLPTQSFIYVTGSQVAAADLLTLKQRGAPGVDHRHTHIHTECVMTLLLTLPRRRALDFQPQDGDNGRGEETSTLVQHSIVYNYLPMSTFSFFTQQKDSWAAPLTECASSGYKEKSLSGQPCGKMLGWGGGGGANQLLSPSHSDQD